MLRHMSMSRLVLRSWPALLIVVLAGCGSGQATEGAARCSGGGLYDYSVSEPGAATPGEAVRELADQKKAAITKELATVAPTEERDQRLAEDRAAVRGLRALQSTADAAEGEGALEAKAEEGDVVARADVMVVPAGGFVISSLRAEADCEPVG